MTAKRPWYKRYPADFIAATAMLTFEQKGAYSIVLDIIYDRGGPLDLSDAQIAHLLNCHWHRWHRIKGELIEAGKLEITPEGKLANRRAAAEITRGGKTGVRPEVNSKFPNDFSCARAPVQRPEEEAKASSGPLTPKLAKRKPRSLTPNGVRAVGYSKITAEEARRLIREHNDAQAKKRESRSRE